MLELILEALPSIEAGGPIDLSRVYLYAVQRKMVRDIKAERTFTSLADKLYFMCEVSWEMLSTDRMTLNYRSFPERLSRLFGPLIKEQKDMDHWHYDMMGQNMLVRNAEGDYAPAHRSLLEFFLAYKLAAELGLLAPDFVALAQAQSYVDADSAPKDYKWSEYFHRKTDRTGAIITIAPLRHFDPEDMEGLSDTVGRVRFSEATLDLLENMVVPDRASSVERLWHLVSDTRCWPAWRIGFVGGNAVTLLRRLGARFKGTNLRNTVLIRADLHGVDLTGSDLSAAVLVGTDLRSSCLRKTNCTKADLGKALFGESYWIRALTVDWRNRTVLVGGGNTPHLEWGPGECPSFFALLDLRSKKQVYNFFPGVSIIWAACLHPGGHLAAIAGDDEQIFILSIPSGKIRCTLQGLGGRINTLKFGPEGSLLVCGGAGGIHAFDFSRFRETYRKTSDTTGYVSAIAISPDGTHMAVGATSGSHIPLLEVGTGEQVGEVARGSIHRGWVEDLCFNSDGSLLAFVDSRERIKLWDLQRRCERAVIRYAQDRSPEITKIAFSPDGSRIASGAYDHMVRVWDVQTAKQTLCLRGHAHYVYDLTWAPDGLSLISGGSDSTVRVWDLNPSSESYGKCAAVLGITMICEGLRLTGAIGLQAPGPSGARTVGEWLQERGATFERRSRRTEGESMSSPETKRSQPKRLGRRHSKPKG
jgi:WD40 repeat protein